MFKYVEVNVRSFSFVYALVGIVLGSFLKDVSDYQWTVGSFLLYAGALAILFVANRFIILKVGWRKAWIPTVVMLSFAVVKYFLS